MSDMYIDVDTAVALIVNKFPLTDDTDYKTRETAIAYNQAGMDLVWNFTTSAGVVTQTAVTPTTAGVYDWTHVGDAIYKIEIPASGGGSINNDTEGSGFFSGICTGVLSWVSPIYTFRAAGINDLLVDSAYSATRGLAGTALPAAAADAAGGLPISDAGGLDIDTLLGYLTAAVATATELAKVPKSDGTATWNATALASINAEADTALSDYNGPTHDELIGLIQLLARSDAAISTDRSTELGLINADEGSGAGDYSVESDSQEALRDAVGNIAVGASAISIVAESEVLTTGTEVNDYTDTETKNGVHHEISDSAGALELYYQFDVGSNGTASEVAMWGRLEGGNDSIGVYAYNWTGAAWDQIGTLQGSGSSTDGFISFNLLTRHTGTGANLGKVRIRGYAASGLTTATLYIDQAYVSYAVIYQSIGYANGGVWIDTTHGQSGTELFVNGVADNPSDSLANAVTIADLLNIHIFEISTDSTITLTATTSNKVMRGRGWTLALGGQDVSNTHFLDCKASGISTGSSVEYHDSQLNNVTSPGGAFISCSIQGTFTCNEAATYHFHNSHAGNGTTPIIDVGAAVGNTTLLMHGWQGRFEIQNLGATGTDVVHLAGDGELIINANCTGGTINIQGNWKITDNSGSVTISYDDNTSNISELQTNQGNWLTATGFATETKQDATDIVIAELTTQGDTNETKLDNLLLGIIFGAAATGTLSTTQATTDLTGYTADQLIGRTIIVTSGVADGEGSDITDYVEAGGLITFTAMTLAMGNGDTFKIV